MEQYLKNYLTGLMQLEQVFDYTAVVQMIDTLAQAQMQGKRIFVFGNGGSSAHANHFACDLGKNVTPAEVGRFHIISICENMATLTAYANDLDYTQVFSEQLKNHCLTSGDIILAISASGNSPNVVQACEYAATRAATIISMTGFDGGKLKKLSDVCLHIRSNEYEKVEDLHLVALHMIVAYFKGQGSKVR